jgi:hypothetical protein
MMSEPRHVPVADLDVGCVISIPEIDRPPSVIVEISQPRDGQRIIELDAANSEGDGNAKFALRVQELVLLHGIHEPVVGFYDRLTWGAAPIESTPEES